MEELHNYLTTIRRDFANKPLLEKTLNENPLQQFEIWFEESIRAEVFDPYAMSTSTVDGTGKPSIRIVYLRGISDKGFIFYTNYKSKKGKDIEKNNKISLNFFWRELDRQVNISGQVEKVDHKQSDEYFSSRPRESQIGAWASDQSEILKNREELEKKLLSYTHQFINKEIPRPQHWGGYIVIPNEIEFWQGRPNRLHDRLVYTKLDGHWTINRLSP